MNDDIETTIWDIDYSEVSELLKTLLGHGLQANRDFEFEFRPGFLNYELIGSHRRSAIFRFRDPQIATWFALKYS